MGAELGNLLPRKPFAARWRVWRGVMWNREGQWGILGQVGHEARMGTPKTEVH